ncbi:hypothetical protein ACOJCM_14720 [Billgrantia sp. LNSP4103-1]|uniref:hypothetical protein n=1 Tax=Billgrantia sp. LNSP4103-1 TaxID=3410266 RepID=UPI00403FB5E7
MNRKTETFVSGQYKLLVTAHDWAPMLEHKVSGVYGLTAPLKEASTWQTGRLMRNARDLALDAVAKFEQWTPRLEAIHKNSDLSLQGRQRAASDIVNPILAEMEAKVSAMNEDIETLYRQAQAGLSPVRPLSDSDVVGHAMDREIRDYLRENPPSEQMLGAMMKGEHPSFVSAVLRAPEPMLAGFTPLNARRLEAAGIAAAFGEAVEMLDTMIVAFDDARVAALRSIDTMAGINELRKSHNELDRRINAAFAKNQTLAEFRTWLAAIPRPAKRSGDLTAAPSEAA